MTKEDARTSRCTKILRRDFYGIRSWAVSVYIDGKYITDYTRRTRTQARELSRRFKESGMLPAN